MKLLCIFSCSAVLLYSGCVRSIAVQTMGAIVDGGMEAITEEQDLILAEKSIPANLKLLEVMLKEEPEDTRLLRLLSEGYSSYAMGFVEDYDVERARALYLRGRDFGMRVLRQDTRLARALDGSIDELKAELADRSCEDVAAIFWTAFGWGSYINLSLTSPDALADLPRVEALMNFVATTDSSFYYGGAHLFLGVLYGGRPAILGGNAGLSKRHFEAALRINQGKFLLTYVYYARSYAVQTLNEAWFVELLMKVGEASPDILPQVGLANAIAKRKARSLLDHRSDFF